MSQPKISVIIPVYNRENKIKRAIQSVLDQKYDNYEIIVVNDASTDDTKKGIEKIESDKIKYLENEKTKGPGVARNKGIKEAEGEFIAFLDSDDEWLPEKLEMQIEKFKTSSMDNLGAVYTSCFTAKKDEQKCIPNRKTKSGKMFNYILEGNMIQPGSSLMIKKEIVDACGFFDEKLSDLAKEDIDYLLRIAKKYSFDVVEEPLFLRYFHETNISENRDYKSKLKANKILFEKYKKSYKSNKKAYLYMIKRLGVSSILSGERFNAIKYFFYLVLTNPLKITPYKHLFASILGQNFYRKVSAEAM